MPIVLADPPILDATLTGAPTDADFVATPPNGTLAINSTTSKMYARIGGVWTQVTT